MERRPFPPRVTDANIYFTGMMGSGKTTLGRLVANELGWPFADTDGRIESRTSGSISQIFRDQGEDSFRDLETSILRELSQQSGWVVSLGGGAVLREINRQLIRERGYSIYLKVRPETILARLPEHPIRPLLTEIAPEERLCVLERLLAVRESYYLQADAVIENEGTPEAALQKIFQALSHASKP